MIFVRDVRDSDAYAAGATAAPDNEGYCSVCQFQHGTRAEMLWIEGYTDTLMAAQSNVVDDVDCEFVG